MDLYVFPPSPNCVKVLALARHLHIPVHLKTVSIPKGEHKLQEFLELNPNGRLPLLVDGPLKLWESDAILFYLSERAHASALTRNVVEQSDILRWMFWQCAHLAPACGTLVYEHVMKRVVGLGSPDVAEVSRAIAALHPFLAVLEHHLQDQPYMCGPRLSIADFSVAAALLYHREAQLPVEQYPAVHAWYQRMEELPAWQAARIESGLPAAAIAS